VLLLARGNIGARLPHKARARVCVDDSCRSCDVERQHRSGMEAEAAARHDPSCATTTTIGGITPCPC
jgi:hypothetical protein